MDENNSNNNEEVVENPQDIQENEPQVKQEVHTVNNTNNKTIKKTIEKTEKVKEKDKNQKRSGDRIVVQYRKPSIFSSVLLVLIGALIAVIICMVLYIWKIKPSQNVDVYKESTTNVEENKDTENTVKEEAQRKLDLSLNGEFVKELNNKIPVIYWIQKSYSGKKITQAELTENEKMYIVLQKMRFDGEYSQYELFSMKDKLHSKVKALSGENVEKYEIQNVEENFKSTYGSDKNILKEDIETNAGYVFEYNKDDDCYYGHYYDGGAGRPLYLTILNNADKSEDGKEVYVYDYYIRINSNGFENYGIYTDSELNNLIGSESQDPITNYDGIQITISRAVYEKYKDKLVKYKHTFVLDDNGNYYWYSSEPVK